MVHHFGTFELDEQRFELRRCGKPIPLPRKVLETITYLVKNRDRLISKDELLAGPWKGTTVTEGALSRCIMLARKALQDRPGPNQMKTVRGKGYRFLADVTPHPTGPQTTTSRPPAPLFFGRGNELQTISRAVDEAIAGRGSIVLVGGEPGIGKTSLLQTFAATIDRAAVLWGRCWEGDGAPAFWPWLEILREYVERHGSRALSLMGAGLVDIAQLLPELSPNLPPASTSTDLESPQARFRAFDSIARFLHRAASSSPLVLFIDDLHAADDPSVLLLQFLARTIEGTPLAIVASYRELEVSHRPTLASFLGGPVGGSIRINLSGLGEEDVGALLASRLQMSVSRDLARRARDTTDGNPFLVSELGRTLQAGTRDGRLDLSAVDSFRMPNRVVDLVRRRLAHLPALTVAALYAASVIGREFLLPVLSDMLQTDLERMASDLEPALREGLVRYRSEQGGAYLFSHSLLRETMYQLLPSAERLQLHFRAAEALERRQRSHAFDDLALQIAQHYFAGVANGGAEKALKWALKAAKHAGGVFAYEVAGEQYEHALQAIQELGGDESQICATLVLLANAQHFAGQTAPAIATLARVETLAQRYGNAEMVARALVACVDVLRDNSTLEPTLAHRLEAALEALPDEDSTLRARVLAAIPIAGFLQASMSERLGPYYEKGVAMARRLGDPATLASVLHSGHWRMMSSATHPETALQCATEMMDVARRAGHDEKVLDGHLWRSHHLLILGRVRDFNAEISEHERLATHVRQPRHLWHAELASSAQARMGGRWREADELASHANVVGLPFLGAYAQAAFAAQMLSSALERDGEPRASAMAAVARSMRDLLKQLPPLAILRATLALAELEVDPIGSKTGFEKLVDGGVAKALPDETFVPLLVILTRLSVTLKDRARASALYKYLSPYSGRHVVVLEVADYWGPVSHCLGVLARTTGQLDAARDHFERTVLEADAIGSPIHRAWAEVELGALLLANRHERDARRAASLLSNSRETAQELGLARLQRRTEHALRGSYDSSEASPPSVH